MNSSDTIISIAFLEKNIFPYYVTVHDTSSKLYKFREILTLLLLAMLPFHAFVVTVLTKIIAGPYHAPLGYLAVWKEGVLGAIVVLALCEIVQAWRRIKNYELRIKKFDVFDVLIVALAILGIATSYKLPATSYLFGFKYSLLPLLAFLILRRVPWSPWFLRAVMIVLLITGTIVALYGIATFFLPMSFFTWLGYSDMHSLYIPGGPLAAFQQIGGVSIRRIQSVMSGPNQLGIWLLIPWGIFLAILVRRIWNLPARPRRSDGESGIWDVLPPRIPDSRFHSLFSVSGALITIALLLTFSRAAWIGAFVMIIVALWMTIERKKFWRLLPLGIGAIIAFMIIAGLAFPQLILRAASSRGHIERPIAALRIMREHPLGLGLGSAGPASNRTSDACVYFDAGADTSWAAGRKDMCIFVADQQVQPLPSEKICACPLLPENWYLQIGVELGILGFILYLALTFLLVKRILTSYFGLLTSFIGISIAALFLHAWEDASVAYTAWILLAAASTLHPWQGLLTKKAS